MLFQKIPEFSLVSQTGEGKSARNFCGRYLVLYFYPKANTPGCTREAQDFTSLLPKFRKLDATIVGVSPDKPEAQAKFVEARGLSVTMLSDSDKTLAREFGALKESGGILRSTFLIDRTGVVRAEWKKVKVDGHASEVLDKLTALSTAEHVVHSLIASRRAYRALLQEPVPREDIETLLASAHLAPSCFNKQSWRFVAIDDPKMLSAVKAAMPKGNYWTEPAPAIIAVHSKPDLDCQLSDGRDYYLFDCGMAVGNLMLQATQMGLVAHPIAGFDQAKVKRVLGIPEEHTLITLVVIARRADPDTLSEKHREEELAPRERRPITEFVSWDKASRE